MSWNIINYKSKKDLLIFVKQEQELEKIVVFLNNLGLIFVVLAISLLYFYLPF